MPGACHALPVVDTSAPPSLLDTSHTPPLSKTHTFVCDLDMTDYSPYNALKAWVATLAYTAP